MKEHDNSHSETDFHIRLMEYIAGEMKPDNARAFKSELDADPNKQSEYEQILSVQKMMHALDQKDKAATKVASARTKGDAIWAGSNILAWMRPFAVAAGLLLAFMIGGYVTNFQMSWSDKGFYAGFGPAPHTSEATSGAVNQNDITSSAITESELNDLFSAWQQQQFTMLSDLLVDEREIQQAQLIDLLGQYAEEIETRRLIDLQIISSELQYQRDYFTIHTLEQDMVLNEIIEIVNTRIDD
ncbi:MAG: hypothetical protein LAT84_06260 [Balneolia bacterium]|nr:hypothetical protein [Balneolia bacterium]